jgi:predicted nucleic acid-binding protein
LTLLRARGERRRAVHTGERLFAEDLARIEWVTPSDVRSAWVIFQTYRDKEWSFTDCVSYAVVERLRIRKAFAFDQHFHQFGIVRVVPSANPSAPH